jgi:hypothetical protein
MRDEWKDGGMLEQATHEVNDMNYRERELSSLEYQYYTAWKEFQVVHYQTMEETRALTWHVAMSVADRRVQNLPVPEHLIELEKKHIELFAQIILFKNGITTTVDSDTENSPHFPLRPGFDGMLKEYPSDGSYWDAVRLALRRALARSKASNGPGPVIDITPQPEDYRLPRTPQHREIVLKGDRGELKISTIVDQTDGPKP